MTEYDACDVCEGITMTRFCDTCGEAYGKGQDEERAAAVQRIIDRVAEFGIMMEAPVLLVIAAAIKGDQP